MDKSYDLVFDIIDGYYKSSDYYKDQINDNIKKNWTRAMASGCYQDVLIKELKNLSFVLDAEFTLVDTSHNPYNYRNIILFSAKVLCIKPAETITINLRYK